MNKLQHLIHTARKNSGIYSPEDDTFITALGLDPEKYRIPGERVCYDVIRALQDTAAIDWADELEAETGEISATAAYLEEPEPAAVGGPLTIEQVVSMSHAVTKKELEELLEELPVIIDGKERIITYSEFKQIEAGLNKTVTASKSKNLFGLG